MAVTERTVWGMHAGKTGDADRLFLQEGHIGLGWAEMGDLSSLGASRDAFKARYAETYPDEKAGSAPVSAGQLYRFVHEMTLNDIVVYPAKDSRQIYIGRITGPYTYNPNLAAGYPQLRSVAWLKHFPRTQFKQGALFEIGSAMSLFQIKNYAHEFLCMLADGPKPPEEPDETVQVVAEQIQQVTRDFILKQLGRELKGHPFASFVAHLLETMGYRTRVAPPGPDGGVDIVAHRDELGFEPPIIKVQVKSSEGSVAIAQVSALYGNVAAGEYGLLVTLGTFTAQAQGFANGKSNLRLINGNQLVELILAHYEQFDSRYKGLLPLTPVYVPETVKEEEE